jgi:hypothetical protein
MEVLMPYMSRAVAQIIDAALVARLPVVKGRPKKEWAIDWGKIHDENRTEEVVAQLLDGYDENTLIDVFNTSLSVAANGVTGLHAQDFYIAMANTAVNLLAREDGGKGLLAINDDEPEGDSQPQPAAKKPEAAAGRRRGAGSRRVAGTMRIPKR